MFGGVQSEIARLRNLRVNISTLSLAIWDFGIKDLSWGGKVLCLLSFFFFGLVNKCLILYSILIVFFLIEDVLK
jgi:hypothetical protein